MRRKLRKPLAILLAFAMMFCLVPAMGFAADDGDNSVKRLSGQNRYETAANIAEDAFPDGAGAVVIANGEPALDYADVLAGSFLAGAADAPILLTNAAQLPDATAKAIEKLGATKAYVLGGELAVSNAVVSQLDKLLDEVERVEGQNRFETAVKISKVGKSLPGAEININTALIANGTRPADALAAGAYANAQGIPVLLVNQNNIPAATKAALAGIENTFVIGGNLVVSDDVASELDATRISGRTGNATSVAVAETLWESPENFALVNGADGIVDALAGSVLGMPILYVPSEDVDAYLNKVITGNSFGFILGGVNRISDEFLNEVQQMIEGVEEELQVESVSAIDKTIKLNVAVFEAAEGAKAKVAIFALDDEGAKTGAAKVTKPALEIEENVVTFDVSEGTFGDDEYLIEVTIAGVKETVKVELAFKDAEAAVKKVNEGTTQTKLWTALQNPLFDGVAKAANSVVYFEDLGNDYKTVAEVIAAVEAINKTVEDAAIFEDVKEALEEAFPNRVAIFNVLDEYFDGVIFDNMEMYVDDVIFENDNTDPNFGEVLLGTMEEIQVMIYVANLEVLENEFTDYTSGLDTDGNATQAEIDEAQRLLDEFLALGKATLPAAELPDFETYVEGLQDDIDDIQDALDAMNEAIDEANDALAAYMAAGGDVEEAVYTDLEDALEADPKVLADIESATTALEEATDVLTAVTDAEAAQVAYLVAGGEETDAEYVAVQNALDEDPIVEATLIAAIEALEEATHELEFYNAVIAETSPAGMANLLYEFEEDEYLDLTSAQRLDFASIFIDRVAEALEDETLDDYGAVDTLYWGLDADRYLDVVRYYNNPHIESVSEMMYELKDNELDLEILEDYADWAYAKKVTVAQAVFAGMPYETWAEIETAINAAVAGL